MIGIKLKRKTTIGSVKFWQGYLMRVFHFLFFFSLFNPKAKMGFPNSQPTRGGLFPNTGNSMLRGFPNIICLSAAELRFNDDPPKFYKHWT